MMPEERAQYLATGSGERPADHERLDLIRAVLAEPATWSEPPPEAGDTIFAAIAHLAPPRRAPVRQPEKRRWPLPVAAAAVVAILLAVALAALLGNPGEETMFALEGTELEAEASGEAAIGPAGSGWWVRLDLEGLEPAPEGTYYEGWMWSDDGAGVSIGTFHLRGEDNQVRLWSGVDPANYPAIWVTLEDEDGDPSVSDRVVMWGRASEPD